MTPIASPVEIERALARLDPPRFKLKPFAELTVGTEAAYLVKGIIPRAGLTVVWGPPKCGKSFWVFDVAMHIALGWEYRGRRVRKGPVVYFAFEGAHGFNGRAEAFRQRFLSEDHEPVEFYLVGARANLALDHTELINCIRAQLTGSAPACVVLDTLNRSLGGSESDDKDMGNYVKAADAIVEVFGCAVVIVHHCGVEGTRPRGHTSLTGAADAQLAVKRDSANNVLVTVEWMKDGPEGDTIGSRLEQIEVGAAADGDEISSCVVVATETTVEKPSKAGRMTPAARTALRALHEALLDTGTVNAISLGHIPAGVRTVAVSDWRQVAYRMGISTGEERAKQVAFQRATERLIGSGTVAVWDDRAWTN